MEDEFKKGAFSYFLLAGLENNCTIYQRLSTNGWVGKRRNTVSDGWTTEFYKQLSVKHLAMSKNKISPQSGTCVRIAGMSV